MKIDFKNKKKLQIMIFVMIAVITLGVGYAAISAINLVISGNASGSPSQNSFSVVFKSASVTTGTGTATIDQNDGTLAYFDVSGISKVGDTAVATYTIKNESNGVGASIQLNVTNSNTEYFQVTESIVDTELQANEQTTATVTVQMIKTPIDSNVTTSITGTLTATPMENADATGSSSATATPVVAPAYKYSVVDWNNPNIIGQALNGEQPSFEAAKTAFGYPVATAHIITGGVIEKSYLAFERNGTVYYIQGGVNERSLQEKSVYEANVATLKTAFGPDWQSVCTDNTSDFNCSAVGFDASADANGDVSASGYVAAIDAGWSCYVWGTGDAYCNS